MNKVCSVKGDGLTSTRGIHDGAGGDDRDGQHAENYDPPGHLGGGGHIGDTADVLGVGAQGDEFRLMGQPVDAVGEQFAVAGKQIRVGVGIDNVDQFVVGEDGAADDDEPAALAVGVFRDGSTIQRRLEIGVGMEDGGGLEGSA
jgi:hypothetical protein